MALRGLVAAHRGGMVALSAVAVAHRGVVVGLRGVVVAFCIRGVVVAP